MNDNGQTGVREPLRIDEVMREKLHRAPILASLSDAQLACLASAEEVHAHHEEALIRQGEVDRHYWILLEGELRLSQTTPDGHEMAMHVMKPGSAFGEVSLLANVASAVNFRAIDEAHLLRLDEQGFWNLLTTCPEVRKAILGDMAMRFQKMQNVAVHQEKMASLGTLAAGLMHELNNPGAAARRAAAQLRENLMRLHALSAKFTRSNVTREQKVCMLELQEHALAVKTPLRMNSIEQSDAEERLAEWMEAAHVEDAWKLAPTLVSIGIDSACLECARSEFGGSELFSDALSWMEAMVSSMQLVATIEESIGRVGDLVHAVKSYAYEGKGQKQTLDVNASVHATLVILGHKFREKQIVLEKAFGELPLLQTTLTGLNQVWTNLLDNAIDAVDAKGRIAIRTWMEKGMAQGSGAGSWICVSVTDDGAGIPLSCQKQVFDPFFTTKQAGVGTGLGLGIVHRIVEQFGGRILFSSEPGHTEFLVRLPSGA